MQDTLKYQIYFEKVMLGEIGTIMYLLISFHWPNIKHLCSRGPPQVQQMVSSIMFIQKKDPLVKTTHEQFCNFLNTVQVIHYLRLVSTVKLFKCRTQIK